MRRGLYWFCAAVAPGRPTSARQWKGSGRLKGHATLHITFKQDGASLTGTVGSEGGGDQQIRDGKVNGDRVTFVVVRKVGAREMTASYSGGSMGRDQLQGVAAGSERDLGI